jgi:hypothetical protein
MEMYTVPEPEVRHLVLESGGRIVAVHRFPGGDFQHSFYCATR